MRCRRWQRHCFCSGPVWARAHEKDEDEERGECAANVSMNYSIRHFPISNDNLRRGKNPSDELFRPDPKRGGIRQSGTADYKQKLTNKVCAYVFQIVSSPPTSQKVINLGIRKMTQLIRDVTSMYVIYVHVHVHTFFGRTNLTNTFYHICNTCLCTCTYTLWQN
jgi:hypothetical protein